MIKVIVSGAAGHMGRIVEQKVIDNKNMEVAALVDPAFSGDENTGEGVCKVASLNEFDGEADVVIDFSHHEATKPLLDWCKGRQMPIVLCTTGQTEDELAAIDEAAADIPIFRSANMSVGVALLAKAVREVAAKFTDSEVEIVEMHHNRKLDAPSGTAILLADAVKDARPKATYNLGRSGQQKREAGEIGISAVRMGNIVGIHEVMFGTDSQTITLRHEAHDRGLFADGAIDAAAFLAGKGPGLYNMDDMLEG